ncbi:hypothetical protein F5B22DRAFT_230650 [Xylaria bambusicola]|uniref:uncharacterized protein n=1 Tax=Xylaria bambusicola TaxID=326684 RepID=UPI0020079A53|nr:uncharacterized protein F5B22DRAFT_230650 [Xylaria bambusicola]KAI0514509.1 hypothetical protein F5B22DRAFT_230650 [Xylaria bambusicola]
MPIPLTCRICAARLARSSFRLLESNVSSLHTKVIPVQRPSHALTVGSRSDRSWKPELSEPQGSNETYKGASEDDSAPSVSSPTLSRRRDNELVESAAYWNGEINKFVPRRAPAAQQLASLPVAGNARELKVRILSAKGEYLFCHKDLIALYNLSHQEARHAVGQLERLLWGNLGLQSAAQRLDQYLAWKQDFATILSALENTNSNSQVEAVSRTGESAAVMTAWRRLEGDRRERHWPQIVLAVAHSDPYLLSTLVESTFDPSWCPSYIVEDVLYLLERQRKLTPPKSRDYSVVQQEIKAVATYVLNKCPPRYLALEQTVLHSVLSTMSTSELIPFFELLKNIEHPLHANTLLHLASRFAKSFDTKLDSLDILAVLTEIPEFDLNSPAAASVCTSLLTLNENEPFPDEKAAPDLLFEFVIQNGLRPNLLGLSALMRNFCIRGHLDTAWKIFDLMLQHGLEPDQHVYSILLNGSKQSLDSASFESIFNIITARNDWSPILLNDFLGLLFRENESQIEQRRRQRKSNDAWHPMLQLYAKFFDLDPLQKFTLFPLDNMIGVRRVQSKYATASIRLAGSLMPLPDSRLMQPDTTTLSLMIGAHIRSLNTSKYVIRYYNTFDNMVKRKDPSALGLLANHGTLMFDIFLRALLQFKETIRFAINEVEKSIKAANSEKGRYGVNLHHHPPSLHTWTILLNGLKNHDDTYGVVAVIDMMANVGGVKPNLSTWNALIQAMAKTGNAGGVVKAIWSLEKAGFQPDEKTIKAFNMLPRHLKDRAIAQLEQLRSSLSSSLSKKAPLPEFAAESGMSKGLSNGPIAIRYPKLTVPKTLKSLSERYERLDIQAIESRSKWRKKRRELRLSPKINSNQPIGAVSTI